MLANPKRTKDEIVQWIREYFAANRKIAASLTNELIEKIKYEQWNGELPTVTGSTPIISLEP